MRTRSETVSFRADQDMLKMIDGERARFGISRGSWARGAITAHLHQLSAAKDLPDIAVLDERLDSFQQALESIASDIAKSLYYILINVGEMENGEARDLVRAKLGQE